MRFRLIGLAGVCAMALGAVALSGSGDQAIGASDVLGPGSFVSDSSVHAAPTVIEPAVGTTYVDPVFGTTVRRLTRTSPGSAGTVPEYSKAGAFNANDSRVLLHGTDGSWKLYDGATLTGPKPLDLPVGDIEPRWSPTNPDRLTYLLDDSVYGYSVSRRTAQRIGRFRGLGPLSSGAEQEVSANGRWFAVHGPVVEAAGGRYVSARAFVVDLRTGRRGPVKVLRRPGGNVNDFLDYVAITPDGRHVMVMWAGRGAELYTRRWRFEKRLTTWDEHGDFCRGADARWWFVQAHYRADPNDEVVEATRVPDGVRRTLWQAPRYNMALHVSCRNVNMPGWAYLSSYWDGLGQRPDGDTAFENEVFGLSLSSTVGSPVVRRLAHTNMQERADYFDEPHATVSRDGRIVLFASNFGSNVSDDQYDDTYAIDLR